MWCPTTPAQPLHWRQQWVSNFFQIPKVVAKAALQAMAIIAKFWARETSFSKFEEQQRWANAKHGSITSSKLPTRKSINTLTNLLWSRKSKLSLAKYSTCCSPSCDRKPWERNEAIMQYSTQFIQHSLVFWEIWSHQTGHQTHWTCVESAGESWVFWVINHRALWLGTGYTLQGFKSAWVVNVFQ